MPVTEATDSRHDNNIADWRLIRRMHTGDNARATLERGAFEAKRAFESRKSRADWKPHTRDLISRLVGELFSRAGEVTRDTEASEDYLDEVGPEEESWHVQMINLAETLVAYDEAWAIMDPAQGLIIAEPQHVTRSTDNAVVLKGTRTSEGTVFSDEVEQDAWTIYYEGRYETYVKSDKEGVEEEQVDDGFYDDEDWAFADGPPARRITLPWRVPFGLSVARAHRALYRMKSKMDEALTNSLGGLLQIATGGDDEVKQAIEKALKQGDIAVPYDDEHGEHKPVNVGTEGLSHGAESLKRKRKEMYRTAYQSLEDASRRMTATETDARMRSGPGAALSVLAETLQSAEEDILPVVAQAEDSRRARGTQTPEVDWPTDFTRTFEGDERELTRDIFGKLGLPVDVETATDVIKERLESNGFEPDRDAIRSEVEDRMARAEQSPTNEQFL